MTQEEIQKKTFEPAKLLGSRGKTPTPSFVEKRFIQLGLTKPTPSMYEALIQSQNILSQIIKPGL
jgi:hypothetical protein